MLLKCIQQQSTTEAVLDFVRIFVSASTLREPNHFLRKLFFLVLIIIVLIISSYVQSDLTAMHTLPVQSLTIDTVDDLIKSNVPIYGYSGYREMMLEEAIHERYIAINDSSYCFNHLFKRDHIACIFSNVFAKIHQQGSQNIHVSKTDLLQRSVTFNFGEDSPLLYEFSLMLIRMREGGFIEVIVERYNARPIGDSNENDLEISLDMSSFVTAFKILVGVWTL